MKNRDALASLLLKVNDLVVLGRELDVDNVNDLADFMDINGVCAVVRCKDCRLWTPVGKYVGKCPFLIGDNQYTGDDHYCSLGEREEDE